MSSNVPTVNEALATLELPVNSSWEDVRQSYREWAKVWHPDRFPEDERFRARATTKMQAINDAYSLLEEHFRSKGREVDLPRQADTTATSSQAEDNDPKGTTDALSVKTGVGAFLRYAFIGSGVCTLYYIIFSTHPMADQRRDMWLLIFALAYSGDFILNNGHVVSSKAQMKAHPFTTITVLFYATCWILVVFVVLLGFLVKLLV